MAFKANLGKNAKEQQVQPKAMSPTPPCGSYYITTTRGKMKLTCNGGNDGFTTTWMYLMPLNYRLKIDYNGKIQVVYSLP